MPEATQTPEPTPAATPPEPAAPPPPAAPSSDPGDHVDIPDEFMEWAEKGKTVRTPPAAEPPRASPEPSPAPAPVAPAAPVAATPAPVAAPAAAEPPAPKFDRNAWRAQLEAEVLKQIDFSDFQSEDVKAELEANPALARLIGYLPKKLAQQYANAYEGLWLALASNMPQAVHHMMKATEENARAEAAFYDKWPKLKSHSPAVLNRARAYRAYYPNATADELTNAVGAAMMVELGLFEPTSSPPAGVSPARPSGVGPNPGPSPAAPKPGNEFEVMAEEEIKDGYKK